MILADPGVVVSDKTAPLRHFEGYTHVILGHGGSEPEMEKPEGRMIAPGGGGPLMTESMSAWQSPTKN